MTADSKIMKAIYQAPKATLVATDMNDICLSLPMSGGATLPNNPQGEIDSPVKGETGMGSIWDSEW